MRILSNDFASSLPESTETAYGGTRRFALDFSHHARANGHEWIGILRADAHHPEIITERLSSDGTRYLEMHSERALSDSVRSLATPVAASSYFEAESRVLTAWIEKRGIDVVFLNGLYASSWILFDAARAASIPVIFQHAGIMRFELDQYHDAFSGAGRELCLEIERTVSEDAAANVFLNTHTRDAFARAYSMAEVPRVQIIPLPHAGWPFEPVRLPSSEASLSIGVVARWDRIKNLEAVLRFAEATREAGLPWRVRCVTSIPDTQTNAEMKSRFRELIDVVAPMDRESLRRFYASIDIALLPSHFDVSPGVVMEALACGVPTLISPGVGWGSEYRECGAGNWIVAFDDASAVIERLRELLTERDSTPIAALASHIETCHNPETVFNQYLSLFTSLAAGRHAAIPTT